MITIKQLIDRKIFKVKDFLSTEEARDLWHRVNTCTWNYEVSSEDRPGRMVHYFDPEALAQTDMWKRIEGLFRSQASLHRAFINCSDHATVNRTRCVGDTDGPTILICLNDEWRRDWGGYMVFFKSLHSNEVVKTIVPEPGSAIIFNQSMCHTTTPVAHWASSPRFMLTLVCAIQP